MSFHSFARQIVSTVSRQIVQSEYATNLFANLGGSEYQSGGSGGGSFNTQVAQ